MAVGFIYFFGFWCGFSHIGFHISLCPNCHYLPFSREAAANVQSLTK
jgi:hypothetical protein